MAAVRDMTMLRRRAQWIGEHRNGARKQLLLYRGFRGCEHDAAHNVRRAKAIAYVLEHYPVVIDDGDLLLGKLSTAPLSVAEAGELRAGASFLADLQRGLRFGPGSGGVGGHRTVDFEQVLERGIGGILEQVGAYESRLNDADGEGVGKAAFYRACRITLEGVLRFAERYRERILALRDAAADAERRRELTRLADVFMRVPAQPPRDFYEAIQAVWFVQLALTFDDASCTGHPDRYLYSHYRKGIEDGSLTRTRALVLIEELYLRSNEVFGDWPETVMVGGTGRDGSLVHNDLTFLCIEAVSTVGLINPNVAVCCREDTPDALLDLGLRTLGRGFSHPAFYNDRIIREGLVAAGLHPDDACYYQNSTCVEITPVGTSNMQPALVGIFPLRVLECMLNRGRPMLEGDCPQRFALPPELADQGSRPVGEGGLVADLDALTTFEAFADTFQQALATAIRAWVEPNLALARRLAERGSCPLVSCFVHDCLDRGLDVAGGGARYNHWGSIVAGFSTTVDSLAAIREAVYRRGHLTLTQLRDILAADFAGAEDVRQFLLNQCPKYGNDDPGTDRLATALYEFLRTELEQYRTCLGGRILLGLFSGWGGRIGGRRVSFHVGAGHVTAATPDGRHARAPLSENIGPAPGADREGLTALVNSVTRTDHRYGLGGISVNWRLHRTLLTGDESRRRVLALVREFMRKGGFEVQVNTVDSRTLRAARECPEQYRNLTVRIAGYSEYFCNVGEAQQAELIARHEHGG